MSLWASLLLPILALPIYPLCTDGFFYPDFRQVTDISDSFHLANSAREFIGLVVECLTQDRGVAGSSLTGGTVLCP